MCMVNDDDWGDVLQGSKLLAKENFKITDDTGKEYSLTLLWYSQQGGKVILEISEGPDSPSLIFMQTEKFKASHIGIDMDINLFDLPRRVGIGSAIVQALNNFCKRSRFVFITGQLSSVDKDKFSELMPFYRKNGFTIYFDEDSGLCWKLFRKLSSSETKKLIDVLSNLNRSFKRETIEQRVTDTF